VRAPGQQPLRILTLDADGRVEVATLGGPALAVRLDPRGCLVGPDGLWAELTPTGGLWTPHAQLDTDGAAIVLPEGAALRITADGTVVRVERDGHIDPNARGTLYLQGYRPGVECAGLLLLAAFLTMMPSMAVVDGHPAMAPPPEGSLCNELRQPKPPVAAPTSPAVPTPEPFPELGQEPLPRAEAATSPRIIGCSTGGAMALGSRPTDSGKPPTMKGGALGCAFPTGPQADGIDGACVSLVVRVGIDGKVTRVRLLEDPGFGFGEAARACIRERAEFEPGTDKGGRPVEQEVKVRVRFAR
jgi:hypothetical protein